VGSQSWLSARRFAPLRGETVASDELSRWPRACSGGVSTVQADSQDSRPAFAVRARTGRCADSSVSAVVGHASAGLGERRSPVDA